MKIISRKDAKAQGLKRYFTGKPCKHGHVSERKTSDNKCCECRNEYLKDNAEKHKQYRKDNAEKINERSKQHYKDNAEKINERHKQYYKDNAEKLAEQNKQYYKDNAEKLADKRKYRYATDPKFKITCVIRNMLYRTLKSTGDAKTNRTVAMLGYTGDDLREYIEKQLTPEMTWDNYGTYWHIDHIAPLSVLIELGITDPAGINMLANLRPLKAEDNLSKGNRYIG